MSIKIGIIGAGGMLRYHAAGFRSAGAEIVAVADVNLAAAQKVAAREGIARAFGDVGCGDFGLSDGGGAAGLTFAGPLMQERLGCLGVERTGEQEPLAAVALLAL